MYTFSPSKQKYFPWLSFGLLGLLSILSILLSLGLGSSDLRLFPLSHLIQAKDSLAYTVIFKLRLPRTACAFLSGGSLALAGALMQALLRNPLADPYVLGISGGAAVVTLLAMALNITLLHLNFFAFLGSLLSMFLVIFLARYREPHFSPLRLLLIGVVMATGWAACISLIFMIAPEHHLRSLFFWFIGDLSDATFSYGQLIILLGSLGVSLVLARALNILTQGEIFARSLGVRTSRLYLTLYLLSSLLTAYTVSLVGCIGFIGLMIPHLLRLVLGSDHRFILPASVLLGGSFLTFADTLARTLLAPLQLPVGIVTALLGVPTFLILLRRGHFS